MNYISATKLNIISLSCIYLIMRQSGMRSANIFLLIRRITFHFSVSSWHV